MRSFAIAQTGTYADFTKVTPVNFEGKYFKSRGPLNTVRSPQGVPALVQAGGSPKGPRLCSEACECDRSGCHRQLRK